MAPQHGPLPDPSSPDSKPQYTFYPPPRRSSLPSSLRSQGGTQDGHSNPPSPRITSPPHSPLSSPPLSPCISPTPRASFRTYTPPMSPAIHIPSPGLQPPPARLHSRSPTPSLPNSLHGSRPLSNTPSASHASLTTTERDSTTPLPGLNVVALTERSTWDRDEDEKSVERRIWGMTATELKRKGACIVLLVVLGVFAIIAIGAGLGVGLRNRSRNQKTAQLQLEGLSSTTGAAVIATSIIQTQTVTETLLPSILLPTNLLSSSVLQTTIPSPTNNEFHPSSSLEPLFAPASPTRSACPEPFQCNTLDCAGHNRVGKFGWCTSGQFSGCACISICEENMGSCDEEGCFGANGLCRGGERIDCPCLE